MTTGRTGPRFSKIQIEDSGGAMRDFPVKTIGNVGLTYEEIDVSAMQELVKGFLTGQATFSLTITGPFDNKAAATASASGEAASAHLSGSHTVLQPLNGSLTARSFGVYFGIQGDWATGDPVFGAVDCVIVSEYTVDPSTETYSCKITKAATAVNDPAWGTSAIAAS
jgi:hypothetical protein